MSRATIHPHCLFRQFVTALECRWRRAGDFGDGGFELSRSQHELQQQRLLPMFLLDYLHIRGIISVPAMKNSVPYMGANLKIELWMSPKRNFLRRSLILSGIF